MITDDNDNAVCIKVYKHHIAVPALKSTAQPLVTHNQNKAHKKTKKKHRQKHSNRRITHTQTHAHPQMIPAAAAVTS